MNRILAPMKRIILLFTYSIVHLSSCYSGHAPLDIPDGMFTSVTETGEKIYAPDSICYFKHTLTGNLIGEWVEVGAIDDAIVSEIECVTMDTTDFATREDKRWVFSNDSNLVWYSGDLTIGSDSNAFTIPGGSPHYCTYELRGANDSVFVKSDDGRYHDTVRITRLDEEYMFIGRITRLGFGQAPIVFTTVYKRRK